MPTVGLGMAPISQTKRHLSSPTLPCLGLSLGYSCELGSYRNLIGAIPEGFMEEVMSLDLFRQTSPAS